MLHLIVAINNKNQIGFKDKLLYRNSIDMIFLKILQQIQYLTK